MALYHLHASVIGKGKHAGGSTGFAKYILREDLTHGAQYARYIHREGREGEDLVAKGHGALPEWAHDNAAHFFLMADRYERKGATVARCYEVALPRELSPDARLELAADLRATLVEHYPHAWAIHNPIDERGQEHPHMHLMFSERRQMDTYMREPKTYFSRVATQSQDPSTHGVRKDRSWLGPARLQEVRGIVATLTNAALEREGHAVAVSHQSLRAIGHDREPERFTRLANRGDLAAQRVKVDALTKEWENEVNRGNWYYQKQREGIKDLGREAILDHVRDRFWQHDQSPARERERAHSIERTIDRAYQRTARERVPVQALEHRKEPTRERTRTRVPALVRSLGHAREDSMQHGAQAQLRDHDLEYDRGYGR